MWGYYDEYVSVAQKQEKAQKALAKLRKKRPDVEPVLLSGTKLASTWWGKAWNKNLESYADYSNRIGRGRSYVRNGMVLDLQIGVNVVAATVMGSGRTPYEIQIHIQPLSQERWQSVTELCGNRIGDLAQLAEGKFPQELAGIFTDKRAGLFPSPKEIRFDCSCPDYADMCKHVAAALYGIGVRLDEDPTMFFGLRNVDVSELLKKSAEAKMQDLLRNAGKRSGRVLEDVDIGELFGV